MSRIRALTVAVILGWLIVLAWALANVTLWRVVVLTSVAALIFWAEWRELSKDRRG